jgi:hypothetical protein
MTYARSGTCRAGRRCVGGFVRDCQTQHNAETNLAPLRRGFFVEVACTLSQASPVDDDHLFGRRHRNQSASTSFKRWAYRSRCVPGSVAAQTRMRAGTTGKPPHDARRHLAPLRSGAAFSFGLRRISDTATKSSARRSVGGLPSNAGARFPVYRSLCWARAQVGKLFAS